ncbi:MAG: DUF3515 domain-containing protein [Nocardioides sp.]
MSLRTRGAVVIPGVLTLAVLTVGGLTACGGSKVPISSPSPPAADDAACRAFLDAVPDVLDGELRRPVDPEDALGAAWGDPPITVLCGGGMPDGFDRFSACEVADGVGWYVPEGTFTDSRLDAVMTTIGRRPIVQVRIPATYRPEGPGAVMVQLAPAIKRHLRLVRPCV